MPGPTVEIADAVSNASPDSVVEAAARLGTASPSWPFLEAGSSLLQGPPLRFIESLFGQSPPAQQKEELAQYLALSAACHALDGWRYISQSSLAFLCGSRAQALHLAYYAELRAALAILARSGIGVLNRKHFALTSAGDVLWFKGLTHEVAWKAIDSWATQPSCGPEVVRSFSSLEIAGDEWASATGATIATIGEHWIKNWSIDLHSLHVDRNLRNEASYRPNLRSDALALASRQDLRFVMDVSYATSPLSGGEFDVVDRAVINDFCRKSYKLLNDPPRRPTLEAFWGGIAEWIRTNKGKSGSEAIEIVKSIRYSHLDPGGSIVRIAHLRNKGLTGVFSRGLLLLRLASALLRSHWQEVRRRRSPQPWQDRLLLDYAVHALVCDAASPSKDYTILHADQELAITGLADWLAAQSSFNAYQLWRDQSHALVELCRFERAGMTAVAL